MFARAGQTSASGDLTIAGIERSHHVQAPLVGRRRTVRSVGRRHGPTATRLRRDHTEVPAQAPEVGEVRVCAIVLARVRREDPEPPDAIPTGDPSIMNTNRARQNADTRFFGTPVCPVAPILAAMMTYPPCGPGGIPSGPQEAIRSPEYQRLIRYHNRGRRRP